MPGSRIQCISVPHHQLSYGITEYSSPIAPKRFPEKSDSDTSFSTGAACPSLCVSPRRVRKLSHILLHHVTEMNFRLSRTLVQAQEPTSALDGRNTFIQRLTPYELAAVCVVDSHNGFPRFGDRCEADCDLIAVEYCAEGLESLTSRRRTLLHAFHSCPHYQLVECEGSPLSTVVVSIPSRFSKCCRKQHTSVRTFSCSAASSSISFILCAFSRITPCTGPVKVRRPGCEICRCISVLC